MRTDETGRRAVDTDCQRQITTLGRAKTCHSKIQIMDTYLFTYVKQEEWEIAEIAGDGRWEMVNFVEFRVPCS